MKNKFLVGLTLGMMVFVGCGEKPKEEQKSIEPTPVVAQAPVVEEPTKETPPSTTTEPKSFDAAATFASKCSSCHGSKGEGKSIFPKLSGQTKEDLAKKLHGYKDGTFGNDKKAMMIPNVNQLSDDEIEEIAQIISKF